MKYVIIVAIVLLAACGGIRYEITRVKIVSVDTTKQIVYTVYASNESADVRTSDIRYYYVSDVELRTEFQNNIGAVYDITVTWDTFAYITKAERYHGR